MVDGWMEGWGDGGMEGGRDSRSRFWHLGLKVCSVYKVYSLDHWSFNIRSITIKTVRFGFT